MKYKVFKNLFLIAIIVARVFSIEAADYLPPDRENPITIKLLPFPYRAPLEALKKKGNLEEIREGFKKYQENIQIDYDTFRKFPLPYYGYKQNYALGTTFEYCNPRFFTPKEQDLKKKYLEELRAYAFKEKFVKNNEGKIEGNNLQTVRFTFKQSDGNELELWMGLFTSGYESLFLPDYSLDTFFKKYQDILAIQQVKDMREGSFKYYLDSIKDIKDNYRYNSLLKETEFCQHRPFSPEYCEIKHTFFPNSIGDVLFKEIKGDEEDKKNKKEDKDYKKSKREAIIVQRYEETLNILFGHQGGNTGLEKKTLFKTPTLRKLLTSDSRKVETINLISTLIFGKEAFCYDAFSGCFDDYFENSFSDSEWVFLSLLSKSEIVPLSRDFLFTSQKDSLELIKIPQIYEVDVHFFSHRDMCPYCRGTISWLLAENKGQWWKEKVKIILQTLNPNWAKELSELQDLGINVYCSSLDYSTKD